MPHVHLFTFRMRDFFCCNWYAPRWFGDAFAAFFVPYNTVFGYLISWQRC